MESLEIMKKYLDLLEQYQLREFLTSLDVDGNFVGENEVNGIEEKFFGKILGDGVLFIKSSKDLISKTEKESLFGKNINDQDFEVKKTGEETNTKMKNLYDVIIKSLEFGISIQEIEEVLNLGCKIHKKRRLGIGSL